MGRGRRRVGARVTRARTPLAAAACCVVIGVIGCTADREPRPDVLVPRLGGSTSAKELRGRPFNQPARNLGNVDTARFGVGAITFNRETTEAEGLGPLYVQESCLGCHADGDAPAEADGALNNTGLLLRLSVPGRSATGGPVAEPTYGLQLQTDAVEPTEPEGRLVVTWTEHTGRFDDGEPYVLREPTVTAVDLRAGPLAADVMTSARIAPAMIGLGLLEQIAETDILVAADPDDLDGDGISGRPNRVWDAAAGRPVLGRFGWKAGEPDVEQQTVVALDQDMGVSTAQRPSGTDPPEMSAPTLDDMVFYNRTIAVPVARDIADPRVNDGALVFAELGCAACHTTTQRTVDGPVADLAGQVIHPFTDLLLHDMGPELADGRPEFEAGGTEWRTAPLWGLGHRSEVVGYGAFLHDGRAATPTEAVLWHGGEAAAARRRFLALGRARRESLAAFLGAL